MIHDGTVTPTVLLCELNSRRRAKLSISGSIFQHNWFISEPVFSGGTKVSPSITHYLPIISAITFTLATTKSCYLMLITQWRLDSMGMQTFSGGNMSQSDFLTTFHWSSNLTVCSFSM